MLWVLQSFDYTQVSLKGKKRTLTARLGLLCITLYRPFFLNSMFNICNLEYWVFNLLLKLCCCWILCYCNFLIRGRQSNILVYVVWFGCSVRTPTWTLNKIWSWHYNKETDVCKTARNVSKTHHWLYFNFKIWFIMYLYNKILNWNTAFRKNIFVFLFI